MTYRSLPVCYDIQAKSVKDTTKRVRAVVDASQHQNGLIADTAKQKAVRSAADQTKR